MVYVNPRLTDGATAQFYNSRVNAIYNETKFDTASATTQLDDEANLSNLELVDHFRSMTERGTLLEIGSGKGYFLRSARDRGYRVYGLELNTRNYERTRRELGETIYNIDLLQASFPPEMFDVIYMRDVVEHLPNPGPFFRELHRIARRNSLLFIETHNIDSIVNRVTRETHTVVFGFEHPTHWSPKTLRTILGMNGFRVCGVRHASPDCTIHAITGYMLHPGFTTVAPVKLRRGQRILLRAAQRLFRCAPLRFADSRVFPRIANLCRRGSVIKVLSIKP
jgi:2-polyprenyl-3-methyl-5-hydroxy-6-metoxy-1,4-benzoquinol methylase